MSKKTDSIEEKPVTKKVVTEPQPKPAANPIPSTLMANWNEIGKVVETTLKERGMEQGKPNMNVIMSVLQSKAASLIANAYLKK